MIFAFSAINVYVKDTEYIIQFFINMAFYATPILYPTSMFKSMEWILYLNPFTHFIEAYRDIFMYHQLPSIVSFIFMMIISLIVFYVGLIIFRKLEKGFAEEI